MTLMEWDESMAVGVEELDEQHRILIDLLNAAYEAVQRHDEHRMGELLDKMQDYAITHFATEEKMMAECGVPDLQAHKFQHAKFNNEVLEFKKKQFEKTNLSQIFVFLSRWLTSHIMDQDKKYIPYMPKPETSEESQP
ncbi:bacteriohemerythrin [Pseudodesulfovibrio sp. zrk46]|uniref:bacteriohemerythrin n=1 Tax=Pseudodesulfovibrio sp. zrk46 TaxID=2725288 RepID=UPI00144917EA|nr:bacteriohemerythrin [Pseudodesulfovibrio sp. zrk46]QJB54947.1 hemerythrin family protein [Pseudodesulfovibrio sp. zrk46]